MALAIAPLREQAHFQFQRSRRELGALGAHPATAPALTVAAVPDVPEAPSLTDAIAARRSGIAPAITEPVFLGGGSRPRPIVAATATVDDPPSLTDAINRRRNNR